MRLVMEDGVELAVRETGQPDGPVVLCVHGFPDNSRLWDAIATDLSEDFRVVVYDVRGAGESDRPNQTAAYRLERLGKDLIAVAKAVSAQPVHLLAHDWGSIQAWYALRLGLRVASYTTISGPDLDHAGAWVRSLARQPRQWGLLLGLVLSSAYLLMFQVRGAAELLSRTGLLHRMVGHRVDHQDVRYGLKLYRAGMLARLARPRPSTVDARVQVLIPTRDRFVKEQVQHVRGASVHRIAEGHWLPLTRPAYVAQKVREFAHG